MEEKPLNPPHTIIEQINKYLFIATVMIPVSLLPGGVVDDY